MLRFSSKSIANIFGRNIIRRNSMTTSHLTKVQINPGIVVGKVYTSLNGKQYNSFKGIPYAQPPLGILRYQSPQPIERFDAEELQCFEHRAKALQRDPVTAEVVGSEDCLFLNVYAPLIASAGERLPVLVWLHGGGFHTGSNSDSRLPLVLVEQNVIVVTVNYRVGALGFLCYPEEGIWGNAGLKDQRLALQWVQENIRHFNGDPHNVTLFGESAGASAVNMHLYASHAHQLFHKVIMQSGTASMEWVFQENPKYKALRLADLLGCKSRNTNEIIEFMQSVSALDIIANTKKVLTTEELRSGLPFPFKPVVEDECSPDRFIDRPIGTSMHEPNIVNMPIIMGYNSAEGIVMLPPALSKISEIDKDLARYVPRNLILPTQNDEKALVEAIRKFYFDGRSINLELSNELVNLLSDYHFNYSVWKMAELHSRLQSCSSLYFYHFEYVGQNNNYKRLFQMEHLNGACHADELCYLFQDGTSSNNNNEVPVNAADAAITQQMCSYWANFARCGKPIDTCSPKPIVWHPVKSPKDDKDSFNLDYLVIDTSSEMRENPDKKRFEFWNEIYNRYKSTDFSFSSMEKIENDEISC